MPTLIDKPEYSANEVYEISQTDKVEGAALGASFGGIGVSNQPHQQLANRTAFLYGRQNVNVGNITTLQGQITELFARNTWANVAVLDTPGTYTWAVPAGVALVHAIVVGGGGGGSRCQASSLSGFVSGGGGGAGGYAEGSVSVSGAGAVSAVVGFGGAAESAGGTTSFGPLVATGGAGAVFEAAASSAGGGGGEGSGGFVNFRGAPGSDGQSGTFIFAGNGADGPWGGGGRAGLQAGVSGTAPGAGGGGAYDSLLTGNAFYGAAGAPGLIIITW